MVPIEALKLALSKETEAIELYKQLSLTSGIAKEIFVFLINEEEKHKKLIEEKIYKISN